MNPEADGTFRLTSQRQAVLRILEKGRGKHLSAEEIRDAARRDGIRLGMATIYRTLSRLVELGRAVRLEIPSKPARYELLHPNATPHLHLICLGCGKILEVTGWQWGRLVGLSEANQELFTVTDRAVSVFGYCSQCWKERSASASGRAWTPIKKTIGGNHICHASMELVP